MAPGRPHWPNDRLSRGDKGFCTKERQQGHRVYCGLYPDKERSISNHIPMSTPMSIPAIVKHDAAVHDDRLAPTPQDPLLILLCACYVCMVASGVALLPYYTRLSHKQHFGTSRYLRTVDNPSGTEAALSITGCRVPGPGAM